MANEEAYQLYVRRFEALGKTMFKRLSPEEFVPGGLLRAYQESERGPHIPTEVA